MTMGLLERRDKTEVDPIDSVIEYYQNNQTHFLLEQFLAQVRTFFELNPSLHLQPFPVIHSIKSRLKDPSHLRDKLERKAKEGIVIKPETLFKEVTDLAGVRVLHLYQDQFTDIHSEITKKVSNGYWALGEPPKAYTWDPETKSFFFFLYIATAIKDSFYTSVHYLVKPNNNSDLCCEIQVRTLFEEIWGEIDHAINYPHQTDSVACREQLRVLSKLVSTGTRLSDSIFRSYNEYLSKGT